MTINDIYDPNEPFTSDVVKNIIKHFGVQELDKILMQRLKEKIEG